MVDDDDEAGEAEDEDEDEEEEGVAIFFFFYERPFFSVAPQNSQSWNLFFPFFI